VRAAAGPLRAGLWAALFGWVGAQALLQVAPGAPSIARAADLWLSSGVRPGAGVGHLVLDAGLRSLGLAGSALALALLAARPLGRRWRHAALIGAAPAWLLLFFGMVAVNEAVRVSDWRPAWFPLPEGGGLAAAALAAGALALGPLGALAGAWSRGAAAAAAGDVARGAVLAGGDPRPWVEAAGDAALRAQIGAQIPALVGALVLVEPAVRVRGLGWLAWRALESRDAATFGAAAAVLAGGLGALAARRAGADR
jgi:hypothetical protein